MDPRVTEHAQIIVDHSIDIQPDDEVLIQAPAEADELSEALHGLLGERGAHPIQVGSSGPGTTGLHACHGAE